MKHKTGKVIMGATLSLAAIAVTIDHTRHPLPQIEKSAHDDQGLLQQDAPCGLGGTAPCSLGGGEAPCSLGGGGRFNDL
jgi:hypothetical protein